MNIEHFIWIWSQLSTQCCLWLAEVWNGRSTSA